MKVTSARVNLYYRKKPSLLASVHLLAKVTARSIENLTSVISIELKLIEI